MGGGEIRWACSDELALKSQVTHGKARGPAHYPTSEVIVGRSAETGRTIVGDNPNASGIGTLTLDHKFLVVSGSF